ncbi:MAG: 3'-5' exonuclease [Candidatus Latescibacterota bacterium]|jgi:inhibitor of KinA sporulation pathway (predicted exonuclease)|nr:MAG: 3'-5' exonuclease [Candidatus Latescibacterota bacterium]
MRYLLVDLEATCWEERGYSASKMEIIEIGAVMLATAPGPIEAEFDSFVRPLENPILSEFCTRLTGIRQEDVDSAAPFPAAFDRFIAWAGAEPYTICSWGQYDLKQFEVEFKRHGMQRPRSFGGHINVKRAYCESKGIKLCGMKRALEIAGLPLEGSHHRGIDDARNIARLAVLILPEIEARISNTESS